MLNWGHTPPRIIGTRKINAVNIYDAVDFRETCTIALNNRQVESTGNINNAYLSFLVNTAILSNVMSLQAIVKIFHGHMRLINNYICIYQFGISGSDRKLTYWRISSKFLRG